MAAIGNVYQIKVYQSAPSGEQFLNVFYYIAAAGTPSADDLNSAFVDDLWDLVRTIQAPSIITTLYECINGNDNTDFELSVAADGGLGGGVTMPLFVAAAFRSPRLTLGIPYSYKRISGIPTGFVGESADGSWDTSAQAALEAVQDVLGVSMEGDNAVYDPVQITGGFQLGVAPTLNSSLKGAWVTNVFPSSQVTRKPRDWQRLDS